MPHIHTLNQKFAIMQQLSSSGLGRILKIAIQYTSTDKAP